MSNTLQDRPLSPGRSAFVERRQAAADPELLAPPTQIVGDKDSYLGNASADIGRRVSDDQLELFVVCQPAEAMLQQIGQLAPDYIAIHDLGTPASAGLLAAVAAAAGRKLQKLVIRRQGYGVALATLQFVELPLQPGRMLRIYTTQVDADTQSRQQLAQVLLSHSRLGVVMVGDLPPHALASSLQPLRTGIATGPWPNRQLLLVPMSPAPGLPTQAAALAGGSAVSVRTTPQVGRAADAWSFISGAWNRLNATAASGAAAAVPVRPTPTVPSAADAAMAPTEPAVFSPPPMAAHYAATQPLDLQPMPSTARHQVAAGAAAGAGGDPVLVEYVQRCAAIKGAVQCCVFDIDQQRSLAHSGSARMAERLAAKGAMLHALMVDTSAVLGLGPAQPDAAITLTQHFLLIRPLPGRPRVALHLVLERNHGNIGVTRAQLHQIDKAVLDTPR